MKKRISIGLWICLLGLVISNCVDKFDAHLPDDNTGLLVVEGNIISDSTVVFYLSRSIALDAEELPQDYNQVNAKLSVMGSDGLHLDGVPLGNGRYQVDIGTLNKDVSYNLEIVYNGDTYTSDPQKPIETEAIDNVTFDQPKEYGDIYICIDTHSQGAAYYMWTYEEDWEVRAKYATIYYYEPETNTVTIYPSPPYAKGWCHVLSTETLIGTTEAHVDNRLKDKRVYSIASHDDRVSCYYSTMMRQRKVSKGEYEYYQEKVKISEEMGGIFAPQPSELPTNIVCSNPNKQVIGYVGVNMNVAEYRLSFSSKEVQFLSLRDCSILDKETVGKHYDIGLYLLGYRLVAWSAFGPRDECAWAPVECTDVRSLGATLNKPSFWPDEIN
ncbi:DUF4249 domain-containing protein [Bacteroides sp.]|uniref:DUF4249 domain-containing protein n=1 Tax=Bacteroides sp. TaxID=29523 RepID=UPI003AB8C225